MPSRKNTGAKSAKSSAAKRGTAKRGGADAPQRRQRSHATFPYTTRPGGLRRFLTEVPNRPRPTRINAELLAGWGLSGSENYTIVRVLKAVSLLSEANEPTDVYAAYMRAGTGPAALAVQVRRVYAPLFEASHQPHRETPENLRNLFNIHATGGADATIDLQIQTFRALCDSSDFEATVSPATAVEMAVQGDKQGGIKVPIGSNVGAAVHLDLHIHLPPGKTSRDYQYMIQDIARYIYGVGSDDSDRSREE